MRRLIGKTFFLLLLTALLLGPIPGSAQTAGPPLLTCRTADTQLNVGGKTTLFIEVANISNLYGYQFDLHFPADLIEFVDGDASRAGINMQLGDFVSADFVVLNDVDSQAGKASTALTQVDPSPARSGTGWLAKVEVRAIKPGRVAFALNNAILASPNGEALANDLMGCEMEVLPEGQPTAEPSATPPPTEKPEAPPLEPPNQPTAAIPATEAPAEPSGSVEVVAPTPGVQTPIAQPQTRVEQVASTQMTAPGGKTAIPTAHSGVTGSVTQTAQVHLPVVTSPAPNQSSPRSPALVGAVFAVLIILGAVIFLRATNKN